MNQVDILLINGTVIMINEKGSLSTWATAFTPSVNEHWQVNH